MTSLKDKVILVTGASAGIGFAITETLARHGAKVVAVARNIEKIQELENTLKPESAILAIKTDITIESQVVALFQKVKLKLGRLDVLINNAGMVSAAANLLDGTIQGWTDLLNLNILGLTLVTREAVKLIESSGSQSGHVININSGTKHMVTALTEGLRKTVQSKNIRVTSLSPGCVATEIAERAFGKENAMGFYSSLDYKILQPQDIADAVVYILTAPAHVNIDELTITPTHEKPF